MATPLLYQNITTSVQDQLIRFQEATNLLNLFNPITTDDNTIRKLIWRYLGEIGKASLSSALWDPTKVKHDIATLAMNRYSSGIEKRLPYEDWKILLKMGDISDANLQQIVEQPNIQGSYYLFQGKKLMDDLTQSDPPDAEQYNFALDPGANSLASTLVRPIGVNQVSGAPNTWGATAGAWSTYVNMTTDINNSISTLVEKGFTDKSQFLTFYPLSAEGAMAKKRASGGDGMRNAFQEFEDLGISRSQLIPYDDLYGYTRAGANPTRALFDIVTIDRSSLKIYYTEQPFTNVYLDQSGTKYPGMNIEAGLAYCPFFIPKYNTSSEKFYKGVSCIRAIVGT